MTPPEKNVVRRVGKPTLYERGCHRPIFARRCFDALVSGRIGSVAELASLEGISDRYEAVASVVI
jgi:hypothetical protein